LQHHDGFLVGVAEQAVAATVVDMGKGISLSKNLFSTRRAELLHK